MPQQPDDFEAERPRLIRLAYRMLGSWAEAEDTVQDAWLRWSGAADRIDAPAAWLTRTVTRLCLDTLKSARARRETYIGPWLPEPFVDGPEDGVGEDAGLLLMLALERLSPLERAAFLLHDIFDTPLAQIAETLQRDAATVRQLAVRARRNVQAERRRFPVPREEGERLTGAFFAASRSGDLAALQRLLAEGAVLVSDGGGKVMAFRNPILGAARILRMFAAQHGKNAMAQSRLLQPLRIDGLPGFVSIEAGGLLQTTALSIEDGRIAALYIMRNPDKLARLAAGLSLPDDAKDFDSRTVAW